MGDIIRALERNETVTLLYRGKKKGVIHPHRDTSVRKVEEHSFFGAGAESERSVEEESFFGAGAESERSVEEEMNRLRGTRY